MKKLISMLAGTAALLTVAAPASATVVAQVFARDSYYRGTAEYVGSIDSADTGAAATRSFQLALYSIAFSIRLTNASNTVTDIVASTGADNLVFSGFNSGNALIGTQCAAAGNVRCVVSTGSLVDLTSLIGELNGGSGIYAGGPNAYLRVITADAVPEPAMLGLFGLGAIGLGLSRRRRNA